MEKEKIKIQNMGNKNNINEKDLVPDTVYYCVFENIDIIFRINKNDCLFIKQKKNSNYPTSDFSLRKWDWLFWTSVSTKSIRLATTDEQIWLDECILKNEVVDFKQIQKKRRLWNLNI